MSRGKKFFIDLFAKAALIVVLRVSALQART